MHVEKVKKYIWIGSNGLIFCIYFLINVLTPYLADDYNMMLHRIYGTDRTIHTVGDVLASVGAVYRGWSGRIESHVLSIAASYMPDLVFDAVNALIYMLVIWLVYRICMGQHKHNFMIYIGLHCLLWIVVPDYGQVMFWMCGAVCYLWPSVFVLLALLACQRYTQEERAFSAWYWVPIMLLLGLLAGNAMENMSAGMLVVMTLYLAAAIHARRRVERSAVALYAGACIGFICLVLAPGNYVREEESEALSLFFKLGIFAYYFVYFLAAIFALWFICCQLVKQKLKEKESVWFRQSLVYGIAAVVSCGCLVLSPSLPERAWYIGCVYALIMLGLVLSQSGLLDNANVRHTVSAALLWAGVFYLVSLGDTVLTSYDVTRQTREREAYVAEAIAQEKLDITVPAIAYTYPFRSHHDALEGLYDIQEDASFWVNRLVAQYYGLQSIRVE